MSKNLNPIQSLTKIKKRYFYLGTEKKKKKLVHYRDLHPVYRNYHFLLQPDFCIATQPCKEGISQEKRCNFKNRRDNRRQWKRIMCHSFPLFSFSVTLSINAEKKNPNFYKEEFTILRHKSLVRQILYLILSKSGTFGR